VMIGTSTTADFSGIGGARFFYAPWGMRLPAGSEVMYRCAYPA
jgi:hypothetical protein